MNDGVSGAAGIALIKLYGWKAALGMIGASVLYIVLPPRDKDGSFNEHEFVARLAVAGIFSVMFGDMAADIINHFADWVQPYKHKSAIDLMAGAPGWWISRGVALFFKNRSDKDIAEVLKEVKES